MTFGPEGRVGIIIGQESADNARFGQDFIFQDAIGDLEGRDEATRVDLKIPFYRL